MKKDSDFISVTPKLPSLDTGGSRAPPRCENEGGREEERDRSPSLYLSSLSLSFSF